MRRSVSTIIISVLVFAGAAAGILYASATAREVTAEALKMLFVFFTTPFILEATIATIFFVALLTYNRWRLHKEGDGWVSLSDLEARESASKEKAQNTDSKPI